MQKCIQTKEAKAQQRKFFRVCGEKYHRELTGKEEMSFRDFKDITMILSRLEFNDYYSYVINRFTEHTKVYADIIINEKIEDDYALEMLVDEVDILMKKFCDNIENERQREEYREKLMMQK